MEVDAIGPEGDAQEVDPVHTDFARQSLDTPTLGVVYGVDRVFHAGRGADFDGHPVSAISCE